jgi:NAD(P)-dependent dehydrogenase (short-subunit alcohol dehydrogenase family)
MDIAIVTGAETPLGLHLIKTLVRQGYRVHGIGNNFSKVTFADSQFVAHAVDLTDLSAVTEEVGQILAKEKSLDLLIHAIDVTPGAAFEKLPIGNLEAILKIGLLGPVMLTRLALPNLLRFRGQLINVIPANKSGSPASAVNALLEGGLREMNRALFDRARDAGLRVTNLVLRQNPEPDALTVKSSEQTHIDLEDVARSVEHLLDPNFANVPAELVLHPRCSAHSDQVLPEVLVPLDPYGEVVLPPKAYCPPEQPKIPTHEKERIDRTIPYTDDEMEDKIAAAIEDFEAHPERYEPSQQERSARKPKRQRAQKAREQSQAQADDAPDTQADEQNQQSTDDANGDEGGKNKRRRGRRRSGRNRNRDIDTTTADGSVSGAESAVEERESSTAEESPRQEVQADDSVSESNSASQPATRSGSEDSTPSKPKRSSGRGRLRSELKKSLVSAEIEAQSEFLPKVDARPQRRGRGRSRPESKATQSEASARAVDEPRPKLITSPAELKSAVGLKPISGEAQVEVAASSEASEVKESKSVAKPKKKAAKKAVKKVARKATKKAKVSADANEEAPATKKVSVKKTAAKKTSRKKVVKKAAKKATKKSATKKAAKKKVAKKKAAKTKTNSEPLKAEDSL